jgi:hypothetical protein
LDRDTLRDRLQAVLKSSRVSLVIVLKEPSGREVTEHLGISPTRILIPEPHPGIAIRSLWQLDSPINEGPNSAARLEALIDFITPFSERLTSLDRSYSRSISLVFHYTPELLDGRLFADPTGLIVSASNLSKLGAWNLNLAYETYSWQTPQSQEKQ